MKIEIESELDHQLTDFPVCPHCGHVHKDASEWYSDHGTQHCDSCGAPFRFEREISVSYDTYKIEATHDHE